MIINGKDYIEYQTDMIKDPDLFISGVYLDLGDDTILIEKSLLEDYLGHKVKHYYETLDHEVLELIADYKSSIYSDMSLGEIFEEVYSTTIDSELKNLVTHLIE